MKSAKQKYDDTNKKGEFKKQTPKGLMYISSPREIAEIIKTIPLGKVMTTKQIVAKLTEKHKVDFTCALTTGIFIGVIANYVEEMNLSDIPYWRVVKDKGILYDRYFRLPSKQAELLKSEGWDIISYGKKQIPAIKL